MTITIVFRDHSTAADFSDYLRAENYRNVSKSNNVVRCDANDRVSIQNVCSKAQDKGGEVSIRD